MRIALERVTGTDTIACLKDFKDIQGRGEISHLIAELELIKQELLLMWVEYDGEEEKRPLP